MKQFVKSTAFALAGLLAAAPVTASVPPIEIVGNKFFYSNNGSYFPIRGVAYQPDAPAGQTYSDPLADGATCQRDLPYLLELNTNVVRVYSVNPSLNHTECMNLFSDYGIYVLLGLSDPVDSIDSSDPQWDVGLYQRFTSVVDSFQSFTNILGFFVGNEVTTDSGNTEASAYAKAAIRDTKAYITAQNYRQIPVGYASNDDAATREYQAEYYVCGDTSERADFYGINNYQWCCDSGFERSGYATLVADFQNLTLIPFIFSEYGCNTCPPRVFNEVNAIFSDKMWDVFSGGVVYEYYQDASDYGLVSVDSAGQVSTLADYTNLASRMATVSTATFSASQATAVSSDLPCPALNQSFWKPSEILPPTPEAAVCQCVSSTASCVVDDSVSSDDYATLFSYLCSKVSCDEISGDTVSGTYGAYSFCDPKDQLNFLLNLYYESNNKTSGACYFAGSASTQNPSTATCTSISTHTGASSLAASPLAPSFFGNATSARNALSVSQTSPLSSSYTTITTTAVETTTEVVTAYTTWCPFATSWVEGNSTYVVTRATTVTVTNCPCTRVRTETTTHTTVVPCEESSYSAAPAPIASPIASSVTPAVPITSITGSARAVALVPAVTMLANGSATAAASVAFVETAPALANEATIHKIGVVVIAGFLTLAVLF